MMSLTLIPALLFAFSWISVTVCEFHTVEAQPGEEVTLMCSNFSSVPAHVFWFRLNSTSNFSRISSMSSFDDNATFYQNGSFDMTSNVTHLFLKIKGMRIWDSGLYFCGFTSKEHAVIISGTYLKVKVFVRENSLMNVILVAVIVFLSTVVFALLLIIRKLSAGHKTQKHDLQRSEIDASDDLNYAALSFHQRTRSRKGPPAETEEQETDVLYAATR